VDMGTSGGVEGARNGACIMIGGEYEIYLKLETIFKSISTEDGYAYMGPSGSGHFVKMVHNGIEYGMMQAIGEGFELLEHSSFDLDYKNVSKVWNNGSIISSYLMKTVQSGFEHNGNELKDIVDKVDSSGEGLWTVLEALDLQVPLYNITGSLFKRFESKQDDRFSNKVVASMRNEFGGHKIHKK
ncbi:MAG: NAD(P)-binding domain-containing protein, partial [Acidaminobacteraceae bacterium]